MFAEHVLFLQGANVSPRFSIKSVHDATSVGLCVTQIQEALGASSSSDCLDISFIPWWIETGARAGKDIHIQRYIHFGAMP